MNALLGSRGRVICTVLSSSSLNHFTNKQNLKLENKNNKNNNETYATTNKPKQQQNQQRKQQKYINNIKNIYSTKKHKQ